MNRLSSRNQPNTRLKSNLSRLQRAAKTVFISLIFGDTAVLIMYYFKDSKISTSLDDHSVRNACRPKTNQTDKLIMEGREIDKGKDQ